METQPKQTLPSKFLSTQLWLNIICFLYPMIILSYGKGYNISAILVTVTALFFVFNRENFRLNTQLKWTMGALLLYFFIFVLSTLIHGEKGPYLDKSTRVFIGILILLSFWRISANSRWIMRGYALAGVVAGSAAFICALYFNQSRAFTSYDSIPFLKGFMPIQSGDMAMTLGLLALVATIYFFQKRDWLFTFVALAGAAMGVLASILSGSRGGWVALPPILLYLIFANRKLISWKLITALLAFSALVFAVFGGTISKHITLRMDQAEYNIQKYEKGNANTSLGIRFTLWKNAISIIEQHPIIGVSREERLKLGKENLASGFISLSKRNEYFLNMHPHNQYFEAWMLRGIPGLFALLGLFLVPLIIFYRNGKNQGSTERMITNRAVNQAGIVLITSVMIHCLSQSFFAHNSGLMFYMPMVSILLAKSINLRYKVS